MSLAPYTHIHPIGHHKRSITNMPLFTSTTQFGRFINLYPGDTHKKWGEILDCSSHGITLRITRVRENLSCSGASYKLGAIHFIPWAKMSYSVATQEEATDRSLMSHKQEENITWSEYIERFGGEE